MGRIILITGNFDIYEDSVKVGKEFIVSHGIDEETGRNIILPNEHPSILGGTFDSRLGEWVIN